MIRLTSPKAELAFDRTSGVLMWGLAGGEQVLSLGPTLHILKADAPAEIYPSGWKYAGDSSRVEGGFAVLKWKGCFADELAGGYTIRMDDAGNVECSYEFVYNGPGLIAREIGLDFKAPHAFDTLSWERRAEHSCYPPDHIGRPIGEAVAHPDLPHAVPARERPHGLVDHPLGCNDFRSAKRTIYWASLTNSLNQGIKVFSDGSQHVRATVELHHTALKVLDYYGGIGAEEAWIYHYGPGKKVETGETLKGTVRLKLLGA
jgi:beta-galactosidase